MTNPTNSALHMMEGQGDEQIKKARKILARLCEHGLLSMSIPVRQDDEDMVLSAVIERAASTAPKSSFDHWVDEVETSGEAEKHAVAVDALAQEIRRVDGSNALGAGALAEALMPFLAAPGADVPRFAIQPSSDVTTLQRELSLAYEGFARERGITKELAAAMEDVLEAYARILHFEAFTEKEIEAMPRVAHARAALSKVQK